LSGKGTVTKETVGVLHDRVSIPGRDRNFYFWCSDWRELRSCIMRREIPVFPAIEVDNVFQSSL
jgi:hypothetical protein